ncbi:MAG: hypothetical protein ACYTGQ_18010 [Planctomycetota bacterium]|jgi:hypothetical protein
MRLNPLERFELNELCWKRIDGTISQDELSRLRALLESHGEARRVFVRCLWLDIDLYASSASEEPADLDLAIERRLGDDPVLNRIVADQRQGLERKRVGRSVAA